MSYLHCPRCRLAIRCRADYLTMRHCPRCLAHAAIPTTLFVSPLNAYELMLQMIEAGAGLNDRATVERTIVNVHERITRP